MLLTTPGLLSKLKSPRTGPYDVVDVHNNGTVTIKRGHVHQRDAICQLVDVLDHRHTYINILGMVHRYRLTLTNYTCRDEYRIDT
ncbi:hypothetical protein G9A89_002150, partial [Geosiphon pyriformis]